ncbi:MAG: hypothetical protein ACP5O2_02625 [Bacteroidales bacterium]
MTPAVSQASIDYCEQVIIPSWHGSLESQALPLVVFAYEDGSILQTMYETSL